MAKIRAGDFRWKNVRSGEYELEVISWRAYVCTVKRTMAGTWIIGTDDGWIRKGPWGGPGARGEPDLMKFRSLVKARAWAEENLLKGF